MADDKTVFKGTQNQSTEKALTLIEFLSIQQEPVSLQYISQELHINNSTAYRFLLSLERSGYVVRDNNQGKYALSMKICSIAHNVALNSDIRRVATPYLRQIGDEYGGLACLSIENEMQVIYLDSYSKEQFTKSFMYIGKIAPMHCTGSGKLFLTEYDQEQLEIYEKNKGFVRITDYTITSMEDLCEELGKVRKYDYAVDREECEFGNCCVAIPIRNYTCKIIASLSITHTANLMAHESLVENIGKFKKIGDEISCLLGYIPD
ncbi:MAG: IclR family transcriptional regulator [Lachnoclostridium sp.]|jgi:DNA-binding IclR family transcriptional regulator|nr:IclR family transcriptional regulator [Lachnoclostridium sp.]